MTHFPDFFRCSTCLPRSNLDPGKFRERLELDKLGRLEIGENAHFRGQSADSYLLWKKCPPARLQAFGSLR